MSMARSVEVWTSLVDLAMDGKSWSIDGGLSTTRLDLALLIDKNKVRDLDLGEVGAKRVYPEVLWMKVNAYSFGSLDEIPYQG